MDRMPTHDEYDHGALSFVKEADGRAVDMNMILDRLAAYEDTGLTPEICAEYKIFEDEAVSKNVTFARIVELFIAECEGRLIVLPCKVMDTVYFAGWHDDYQREILKELRVQGISLSPNADGLILHFGGYPVFNAPDSDIGKTIFLTREEAEAALEEAHNGE